MSTMMIGNGISQGIAAIGQAVSTGIQYRSQKDTLKSQERIENSRYNFACFQLSKESELMQDVEGIAKDKRAVIEDLAVAQKKHAISKARYTEMRKTQKANTLNTKAILAKRNQAFYGSPIRST